MKNFSGVCQATGADKPLRAFFIWITNIVTLSNEIGPCKPYGFQGSYCVGGTSRERGRNAPAHTVATHYKPQRILALLGNNPYFCKSKVFEI